MNSFKLHHGDCLEVLKTIPDNSIDAIVTDPPYGLKLMGKRWDHDVPSVEVWQECFRVLKPGGHVLSFSSSRTYHRMTVNIEDAGFEIRDMIAWIYADSMPKGRNISKSIDAEYMRANPDKYTKEDLDYLYGRVPKESSWDGYKPITESAKEWYGWNTSLKPAIEPIALARKPLEKNLNVENNVLKYRTGAININGCRIISDGSHKKGFIPTNGLRNTYSQHAAYHCQDEDGRYPANVLLDDSEEVKRAFPVVKRNKRRLTVRNKVHTEGQLMNGLNGQNHVVIGYDDAEGSASKFFYCAKANKKDRDSGLDGGKNTHITVKPTELMRYLCRLITPPGGIILDPYMGSGSTGKAAMLEGFSFEGIEIDETFLEISRKRIQHAKDKGLKNEEV